MVGSCPDFRDCSWDGDTQNACFRTILVGMTKMEVWVPIFEWLQFPNLQKTMQAQSSFSIRQPYFL
jgi:hypothetical protein